jgi:hypothetical protein
MSQSVQISESDLAILARAKQIASEVNQLNTDLIGNISPLDTVAQSIEEVAVLKEFRMSKYNYRMEKIKSLKNKFNKTFH